MRHCLSAWANLALSKGVLLTKIGCWWRLGGQGLCGEIRCSNKSPTMVYQDADIFRNFWAPLIYGRPACQKHQRLGHKVKESISFAVRIVDIRVRTDDTKFFGIQRFRVYHGH